MKLDIERKEKRECAALAATGVSRVNNGDQRRSALALVLRLTPNAVFKSYRATMRLFISASRHVFSSPLPSSLMPQLTTCTNNESQSQQFKLTSRPTFAVLWPSDEKHTGHGPDTMFDKTMRLGLDFLSGSVRART